MSDGCFPIGKSKKILTSMILRYLHLYYLFLFLFPGRSLFSICVHRVPTPPLLEICFPLRGAVKINFNKNYKKNKNVRFKNWSWNLITIVTIYQLN